MKLRRLFLVAALALASSNSLPSFASHPNIEQHYYQARREYQLIDTSPLLTDHRVAPTVPQSYVIEAPMATMPAPPPVVIQPNANAPMMTILHNDLPAAGFQSAITPGNQQRIINNLPNGNSTNMLAGRMINKPAKSAASNPAIATTAPTKSLPAHSIPRTMVYSAQPIPSSGGQSRSVSTAVKGTLARGALLSTTH